MKKVLIAAIVLFLSCVGIKDCLAWGKSVSTSNVTITVKQDDQPMKEVVTKASAVNTGKNGFAGSGANGIGALSDSFNSGDKGIAIAVSDILSQRAQKEDAGKAEAVNTSDGKTVATSLFDQVYFGGGFGGAPGQGSYAPDKAMTN